MTNCVAEPDGVYPAEPARPKAGTPIPDTYVTALIAWGNRVLGIAEKDRIAWRGERRCIHGLQEAGQIR